MNVYESGSQKNIPAVLIYCRHGFRDGARILMIHRNSETRPGDDHSGKWNGLGGKCEKNESYLEAARRELREESGLDLPKERFRSLGLLQFPNFKAHKNEDWTVMVFAAEVEENELVHVIPKSDEGELHWIPEADLEKLNLWPGDRHFIPFVSRQEPFYGAIWYDGPSVTRVEVERVRTDQ